ncbi:sulfurtransferase complex subunit TusB [Thalassotalea euphylliae]|uniref:sulfurtransferase complex subunit TusB n=1 Tax=Thalassotalea euphylliae TaxID=1655234 RepID=UPI0036370A3A
MTTLHLVRRSWYSQQDHQPLTALLSGDDAIMLLDDGVYNIGHPELIKLIEHVSTVYVIEHHFKARGLDNTNNAIQTVSMKTLIELSLQFDKTLTWQ